MVCRFAINLCKCDIADDKASLTRHSSFISLKTSDGTFPRVPLWKVENIWAYFQFALDLAFQTETLPQGAVCYFSVVDQQFA